MKKILYLSIAFLIGIPSLVSAVQISVPSAPSAGYALVSTSTGAYTATTTDPFHAGTFFSTSTSATSTFPFSSSTAFSIGGDYIKDITGNGLTDTAGSLGLTAPVSIANGGTNNTTAYTAGSIPYSNGTSLTQNNANLFWNNANTALEVGSNASVNSNVKFLMRSGAAGAMGYPYEVGVFERNGDSKLGIYNSSPGAGSSSGASLTFGYTGVVDNDGYFPGLEFQYVGSAVPTESKGFFTFLQRHNPTGNVDAVPSRPLTLVSSGRVGVMSDPFDTFVVQGGIHSTSYVNSFQDGEHVMDWGVSNNARNAAIGDTSTPYPVYNLELHSDSTDALPYLIPITTIGDSTDSQAKIGINNNNPSKPLSVVGNGDESGMAYFQDTFTGNLLSIGNSGGTSDADMNIWTNTGILNIGDGSIGAAIKVWNGGSGISSQIAANGGDTFFNADGNGNVGVKTSTPRGAFDVNAENSPIYLDSYNFAYLGDYSNNQNGTLLTVSDGDGDFKFKTSGSSVNGIGKIWNDGGSGALTLYDGDGTARSFLSEDAQIALDNAGFSISNPSGNADLFIYHQAVSNVANPAVDINYIGSHELNAHVVVDNFGRVGLGTSTPWATLSVEKSTTTAPIFVVAPTDGAIPYLQVANAGNIGIGTSTPYANLSVQTGTSTGDAFAIATSSGKMIAGEDNDGHRFTGGPAPVISSCGTGTGTVVGDDQAGTITTATAATACTATFAKSYKNAPVCTVTDNSLVGFADVSSVSTSAITFGISSALTGGKLYYSCSYHK